MADFMDLGQFKQNRDGKWRFIRLGYAKPNPKGGWYLNFDALPLPDAEGRVSVAMKEQQERSEGQGDQQDRSGSSYQEGGTVHHQAPVGQGEIDSDIPF